MKNLKTPLFVLMAAAIIFTSCGKDGAVGPSGPSGSTGATGPTGATGADGTKIYSGAAAPATTVGANGDFYLNTANSDFYGPKSAAGWGTPTNLKGATGATGAAGAAGAAGSKIYSGSGAPAATVGSNGDYYLDVTGYLFYGPKAAGAWSAPINLKGPKGDPGTANVIYSDWYTPPTYTKTTIFGTVNFTADIAASKITQAILDKGAVFVYGKLNGYNPVIWPTDQVSQLPIAINYMSGATPNLDTWSGLCTVGNVRITLTSSINAYGSISNAHQFRYVIVPGGVHTIGSIDPKNYKQMQQLLGIKD